MAGGFTTVELVAAVSNAKALGSLGAAFLKPEEIRQTVRDIKAKTAHPFNVNLFAIKPYAGKADIEPFRSLLQKYQTEFAFEIGAPSQLPSYESQIEALLQEKIPVFSFTFGIPEQEMIREFQKQGTYVIGTATHVEEVGALEDAGVDAVVCQGKEAGGHRGTFIGDFQKALIPTFELLAEGKRATKLPLIASGGIMEKGDVIRALHNGAAGVQMGTAFMTCFETGGNPIYKKMLLEWQGRKAVLTRAFSGRWARGVENRYIREMAPHEKEIPPYPLPHFMTQPMRKAAGTLGHPEFLSIWAGERFSHCKSMTAEELIQSLF
jgi:nitronate monooxygenase